MQNNKRVKMTLMLDSDTFEILKEFAYQEIGETNVSKAVRILATKHGKNNTQSKKQTNT